MDEGDKEMEYPKKIAIGFQEGTCPLQCAKCFAFSKKAVRKKSVVKMPLDKAKMLIDEIALMEKKPKIQPHIFTEPFANADLPQIIEYCLDRDIHMSIITNGILLDDDWIAFLIHELNREYTISFSLDAITQETYEKVRGRYDLKNLEEKICYIIHNRKDKGPRVGVNFAIEEENYAEADAFIEKWKYKVDAVRIDTAFNFEKKIPFKLNMENQNANVKCGHLEDVMTIDADGQVRCCQLDAFGDTLLGNVFEEGILNVWRGPNMKMFRAKQERGLLAKEDFCYGCEVPSMTNHTRYETDEFIINKAGHSIYYNYKGEIM